MRTDKAVLDWLLEEDNPGVRVRALTGLCGLPQDHKDVKAARRLVTQTLHAAHDLSWMELKGLTLIYNLTALAESGLSRRDVRIGPVVKTLLAERFDAGCGDMMLLRALVMLGYADDRRVQERLAQMADVQLPDGGWLCLHRLNKMDRIPKSCIKAAMHGLLLAGELHKRGRTVPWSAELIDYFLRRRLFYRMGDPARLVLDSRPGRRMTDVHFPIEVMRVGLPVLLEAFAALGVGQARELQEAWRLLDEKSDEQGRLRLEGTLNKSYLPKERRGKPSKWATLYASLALKNRDVRKKPRTDATLASKGRP
jgi:hypothetical protein